MIRRPAPRRIQVLAVALAASGQAVGALSPVDETVSPASARRGAFLARSQSARGAALGGAWSVLGDDATAAGWNPAGLGGLASGELVAAHQPYGGGFSLSSLALAAPIGRGVAGWTFTIFDSGSYLRRDDAGMRTGAGRRSDLAGSMSWALPIRYGWIAGGLEAVREDGRGALPGANAGVKLLVTRDWRAGLALRHVSLGSGRLPGEVRAGISRDAGRVRMALETGIPLDGGPMTQGAGLEWAPAAAVRLRGGWSTRIPGDDRALADGLALGAGVRLGRLALDWAVCPAEALGIAHLVSVAWRAEFPHAGRARGGSAPDSTVRPGEMTAP